MNYDMLMQDMNMVHIVALAMLGVILVVYVSIDRRDRSNRRRKEAETKYNPLASGSSVSDAFQSVGLTLVILVLVALVGAGWCVAADTIENDFCDIGEHVQTTAEYNTAYHIPFEGVVLEHVKGDKRVVVDRNGTQQTFHIRWLEEVIRHGR